jgi:WD repeat-containing protein mio
MLVAAALAGGFGRATDEPNRNIWKGLCRNLSFQLQDAYLRALFGLLASDGNWELVLSESTSLPLCDRMVMSLRFLDDHALSSYISKWVQKLKIQGRIDGLLLTGWTKEGVDLLESYLDQTSDIQSVSLLLARYACPDPRAEAWIETYCDLLDRWEMFKTRAFFDIFRQQQLSKPDKIPSQIFIRCNFCNQPISQGSKPNRASGFIPSTITLVAKTKPTSCPTCFKSLPRCSLCLLPMGTPFENINSQDTNGNVI